MNNQPPKFFHRFLRWFCHPKLIKPIEGDLLELYEERIKTLGKRKADRMFRKDVVMLFRKDIIKPASGTYRLTNYGMLKNYFKTTIRNLKRQRLYAVVNIGGLSIGIACLILIVSYIKHEFSYDQFLENHDRIYRVINHSNGGDFLGKNSNAITPLGLAGAMVEEYPEVETATVFDHYQGLIGKSEESLFWEEGIFSDKNFFQVMKYPFIAGDPKFALNEPNNIVISQSLASKLFDGDAMGKQIIQREDIYQITGIIKDTPITSSIQFSFVANVEGKEWYKRTMAREKWRSNSFKTFFTVKEGVDVVALEEKMPDLLHKYWIDMERYPQSYAFESLKEIHLQADLNFDIGIKGSKGQLLLFSIIAILILVLAAVNYTNLAVARSISRFKEVGLRKTIGAHRSQLMFQFLFESVVLTIFALGLAGVLAWGTLPMFSSLLDRPLYFNTSLLLSIAPLLAMVITLLGIAAGFYPAFIASRLRPIHALKGKTDRKYGARTQKWLIIGQFAVSISMIICALEANQQFKFIQNKDLGFQKNDIITIRSWSREVRDNYDLLRTKWLSNPNILDVAGSQYLPINIEQATNVNDGPDGDPNNDLHIYQMRAGYDFLNLYDIELIAGRQFTRDQTDSLNMCIINETTARTMGWTPEEAVGKRFTEDWDIKYREVIGVIKDFHIHSVHLDIEPLLIERRSPLSFRYISFKVNPEAIAETSLFIEESIKNYTNYPFEARLLSDRYDDLYENDIKQSKIFNFFTLLAITIASLGLFGLTTYSTHLRIKEVGVRKVLGASIQSLVALISFDFLKLVGIGFLAAIPIAWIVVNRWLRNYSYHTEINWWIFGLAGLITILAASLTMSFQTIRVAKSNPIESLKDE